MGTDDLLTFATEALAGRTAPPALVFQPLRTRALTALTCPPGRLPKLLCLVAPVGYGKTVLMSSLLAELRRVGKQGLWFALDERDTAAETLIAAIEGLLHGWQADVHPTQALFRGETPIAQRIGELVERVNAYPLPVTIFLDNIHACTDPALGQLLDSLLFQTRSSVQWVLSSTRELPCDLVRAQLQGLVRQLGPAELCFDAGEVSLLLGAELSDRIGQAAVDEVARETEGWPAAVRMAQIILSNEAQPLSALKVFSGADKALAQLLKRQVLSGFPPEVRDFLFCIAQLRTFCLDLCLHVFGSEQARAHLAYLIERHVFLIPLDRQGHWYRLHGLFREFVLSEAEQAWPAPRRLEVMARAAGWCERQGLWREAVDYALASGAGATARRILAHRAAPFVRDGGQVLQYIAWLEALHAQGHQADPEAEYWFAWALAFRRRYDYARQQLDKLVARLARSGRKPHVGSDELARRIAILRTSIDSLSDAMEDAHRGAAAWLAEAKDQDDDPFNVTAAHCIETHYFSCAHRFAEARRALQAARESAFQAGSANVDGWVAAYGALIAIQEGDLAQGYPELVQALALARSRLGEDSGICGTLAMVAARCAIDMGLDEEAAQLVKAGLRSSRNHGFLEAAACGLDAAVKLWQGPKDAQISLPSLRELAACYPPRLSLMLSCFLVRRCLVLGRVDEAREEAERIGLGSGVTVPYGLWPEIRGLASLDALVDATRIDLLTALGKFKQAEALIATELTRAKASHCVGRSVSLALSMAEIALRSSEQAMAVRHITHAIKLAAPRGIVRPFHDKASCLAAVVADTRLSAWGLATSEERQFFVDRCRSLSFADPTLQDRLASLSEEQPVLLAHLTSREMELLGFVDAGLSNQQIADRIEVSLTTVKWHLQNLFAKLSVTSRSAALARARVLNLLAR